jgi:hypothetical protein
MNMREYSTLHLNINSSKGKRFLLLFYISQSQYGLQQWARLISYYEGYAYIIRNVRFKNQLID